LVPGCRAGRHVNVVVEDVGVGGPVDVKINLELLTAPSLFPE